MMTKRQLFQPLLLLLATLAIVTVTHASRVDPNCDNLLEYTFRDIYLEDTTVSTLARCDCFRDAWDPVYLVSCFFDYCPACDPTAELCIIKQDAYVYNATMLDLNASMAAVEDALDAVYFRHYFNGTMEPYNYTELTVESTSATECSVEVTDDNGLSSTICQCTYQDCNDDGTVDRHFGYTCSKYDHTAENRSDVVFGMCDATKDTHAPANFSLAWPIVALSTQQFDFSSCYDSDNVELFGDGAQIVAGLGLGVGELLPVVEEEVDLDMTMEDDTKDSSSNSTTISNTTEPEPEEQPAIDFLVDKSGSP